MGRKVLVICDSEPMYAKGLMEYICLNGETALQVRVFSDAGQLFQYGRKHEIDLLLMEDQYPEEMRKKIPAKRRFLLVREAGKQPAAQETAVWKYQAADRILHQLMQAEQEVQTVQPVKKKREGPGRLIGIYSPVHRIGKTKFALDLAEQMGQEEPVLYLNLEEYSGMEYCVPIREKADLGDLLYYAKQEQESFGLRLGGMVCQMSGIDYIQPMRVTRDLRKVKSNEWKELFGLVLEKGIYSTVILDLGESIQGLFELLGICDTVYTLYTDDPGARAKLAQYSENLRQLGYEEILEHTIQIEQKG